METFAVKTGARNQLINIDHQVQSAVQATGVSDGVVTVFTPHTTAGITINENADPDVCHDLLEDLARLAPKHQSYYQHMEGNSDSHLKSSIVGTSEQVILQDGHLVLGTWQSLYFAEFDGPRTRKVHIAVTPC